MKEEDKYEEQVNMSNEACKMTKELEELNIIVGAVNNDGTSRMANFEETNDWMSNVRHAETKRTHQHNMDIKGVTSTSGQRILRTSSAHVKNLLKWNMRIK